MHELIVLLQTRLVPVEAVGVLHDELAGPDHPETRAYLVTELGLDLIEHHRQLAVTGYVVLHQAGNDLLMGRAEAYGALAAVGEPVHHFAQGLVPPGLLPDLQRLQRRKQQFGSSGRGHLLADDALDVLQHP
jgi:hypothetical protein